MEVQSWCCFGAAPGFRLNVAGLIRSFRFKKRDLYQREH
jgi:hypothetical protein